MKGRTLIEKFELAALAYSWIGVEEPSDHERITKEYQMLKKTMRNLIGEQNFGIEELTKAGYRE